MPYITVQAGADAAREDTEMLRERINLDDLESPHFCSQLVERLQWATRDACAREQALAAVAEADRQPPASVLTTAS